MPRSQYIVEVLDEGYVLEQRHADVQSFQTIAGLLDALRARLLIERNFWPADPDADKLEPNTYRPLAPIDLPKGAK